MCSVNCLIVSRNVDLSCLKLIWLFFSPRVTFLANICYWETTLSVDQTRGLTSFTQPFYSPFIIESYLFYIWNVSNISNPSLPALVSRFTWMLTSWPALCIFFPIHYTQWDQNNVPKSFFLIMFSCSKATNDISAT